MDAAIWVHDNHTLVFSGLTRDPSCIEAVTALSDGSQIKFGMTLFFLEKYK